MRFHRHFLRSWAILICLAMLVSEPASARQDAGGRSAMVVTAGEASGQVAQIEQVAFPASAVAPLPLTIYKSFLGFNDILHVAPDQGGVWLSDVDNNLVRLNPSDTDVMIYTRQDDGGRIWSLKRDQAGKIWYTTAGADPDDAVGKFDPITQEFTEWSSTEFENLTGLDIDITTGMIWFSGAGANGGIYRLNPAMKQNTIWTTAPYSNTYDLALAPGGNVVWATLDADAPSGKAGLLRLDLTPSPLDELTVWDMTGIGREPYFVVAESEDEIWFTDIEMKSVSNFVMSAGGDAGTLSEYLLPPNDSLPSDLLFDGEKIWFTDEAADRIGYLQPDTALPVIQILPSTATLSVSSQSKGKNPVTHPADTFPFDFSSQHVNIPGNKSNPYTLYDLPDNSYPLGIARGDGGGIWFAAVNYIGLLPTQQVFLPAVLR